VPRRFPTAVLAAACALGAWHASALGAASALPKPGSNAIWATVDVCDTPAHPHAIGIRGSMPGTGDRHETMFMAFAVEYRDRHGRWQALGGGGSSGFVALGDAASRLRQAGRDFTIATKKAHTYLLRGVVTFEWRLRGRVVASAVRSTTAGHHASAGADPAGYSASVCSIALKRRGSLVITPVTPSAARRASSTASLTVHT
jgi:hypothetical protein